MVKWPNYPSGPLVRPTSWFGWTSPSGSAQPAHSLSLAQMNPNPNHLALSWCRIACTAAGLLRPSLVVPDGAVSRNRRVWWRRTLLSVDLEKAVSSARHRPLLQLGFRCSRRFASSWRSWAPWWCSATRWIRAGGYDVGSGYGLVVVWRHRG
jgi:hypothetical protein